MIAGYSEEQGQELIQLARKAIESKFSGEKVIVPDKKEFRQARGVFVTLNKKGKLRGCIGFPHASFAVGEAVVKAAKSAAFEDPRFAPLEKDEINGIKIEVSVLTEPSEIKGSPAKEIEVGKDGLICECLGFSGLLLPQVAVEYKMNKIQFLEAVCEKAGLPKDFWQNKNAKFYKFQAQIFKEK
ncbi:MAG: TIGR00296 family protein [Nanoarchaeota archaeon]|nr:TIGR00296 family protein [Nanoarchaeota archaeon]